MNKILIVHVDNALGFHFFDWSLKFLSNEYEVVTTPLAENTAHNHKINTVCRSSDLQQYANCSGLTIVQLVLDPTLVEHNHNNKLKNVLLSTQIDAINTALLLEFKVVLVELAQQHWLVPSYQDRYVISWRTKELVTRETANQEWVDLYFQGSDNKWQSSDKWDQREILALCLRPDIFKSPYIEPLKECFKDQIDCVSTQDLWFELETTISKYVTINSEQLDKWRPTYLAWKQIHEHNFSQDYWDILRDIKNGSSRDLQQYNLNLSKEALIQHGMIFAYNLNFKTWQLDCFPDNTRALHLLLEPNIHTREFTYSVF